MLTVSPFESLVTEAQLIPAAACKSFFFMSLSINPYKKTELFTRLL